MVQRVNKDKLQFALKLKKKNLFLSSLALVDKIVKMINVCCKFALEHMINNR